MQAAHIVLGASKITAGGGNGGGTTPPPNPGQPPANNPTPAAGTWIGAHRSVALSEWQSWSSSIGPWTVTRTFPWPPDTQFTNFEGQMSPDVRSVPAMIWPTLELRATGSWAAIAGGSYDASLQQLANWFPKDRVSYFTIQHEWENQMSLQSQCGTAADYAAMYRHIYPLMKAINPKLKIVPISMAYAWEHTTTYPNLTDSWMGADACDGLAVDTYWSAGRGTPQSMFNNGGFMNWYNWARTKGVPLHITEWGYDAFGAVPERAQYMSEFGNWVIDQGFETLQYWDSNTGAGGQPNTATYSVDDDPQAQAALKAIGQRGRPFADALL